MTVKRSLLATAGMAVVAGAAVGAEALLGFYGAGTILLFGGFAVGMGAKAPARYAVRAVTGTRRRGEIDQRGDKHRVIILKQLRKSRRDTYSSRQHLGRKVAIELAAVVTRLDDIMAKWPELVKSTEDQYTVEAMITEYIPGVLDGHRNLPGYRLRKTWLPEQERAREALLEQIRILNAEAIRIQKRLYSSDLRGLEAHGSFLRERYDRQPGLEINRD